MTQADAIKEAVQMVSRNGETAYVLRRGGNYKASPTEIHGYKVAEMIGPGNVQNYNATAPTDERREETIVRIFGQHGFTVRFEN
jgi:hypothetical protein